jgi:hypothetical protein
MRGSEARAIAQQWVEEEASTTAGFAGAFIAGSTNWLPEDAEFPPTSDIDIKLVLDTPTVPEDWMKVPYHGVVLEASYVSLDEVGSAETVLAHYYLAGHLAKPSILADPTGHLGELQPIVAREYARREWVTRRCEHARDWMLTSLTWLDAAAPLHEQAFAWLYPTSLPTHVVLVADLQNPTGGRKALAASREVLASYGHLSLHETVLDILGSAAMGQEQVETLLASCADAFDAAKAVITTPFFFDWMISDSSRPTAIDGAQELIRAGFAREAVLWIAVIHSWCQKALQNDAPESVQARYTPSYEHLLAELGIGGPADIRERVEHLRDLVPEVMEVAKAIIAANPAVTD